MPIDMATVSRRVFQLRKRRPLGRRPGSKAQAFRDFIVEASVRGVTLHDMYQFADANQLGMAKNNVRGRLWGMKKRGEIVERNGRYYYVGIGPEAKAPDPTIPAPVGAAE